MVEEVKGIAAMGIVKRVVRARVRGVVIVLVGYTRIRIGMKSTSESEKK